MTQTAETHAARLSVAPMMAWTDRHCRAFHRKISQRALLYTEMVTAAAVVHGDTAKLLEHNTGEHPVALQLGGSDPTLLQQATALAVDHGYAEVNLNCGCPSDRVQSGAFGAVLMTTPDLVARCVEAMSKVQGAEITVKCRIGVDDQTPSDVLPDFLSKVAGTGCQRFTIHARKAWLQGLSPKENRDIPPLDYDLVLQMRQAFPDLHLSINGGIDNGNDAKTFIDQGLDGVMIGRAAYHMPYDVLAPVDTLFFDGEPAPVAEDIAADIAPYIANHLSNDGRLHHITRHMLGLFSGKPGARHWRRRLSDLGANHSATVQDYEQVIAEVVAMQAAARLKLA